MKRVATASASGRADDACSNPSCPKNPYYTPVASVCTALSFWKLPKYWSKFLASCRAPPAGQNYHRHFTVPIGTLLDSSALQIVPVGTKFCRSAETSCRRQFDSKQRTDSAWHGVFRHMWAWSYFLSYFELKEAWPSIFESSKVHDDSMDQICHLIWRCMQQTTWKSGPYQVGVKGPDDRESRHITSLEVWMVLDSHT